MSQSCCIDAPGGPGCIDGITEASDRHRWLRVALTLLDEDYLLAPLAMGRGGRRAHPLGRKKFGLCPSNPCGKSGPFDSPSNNRRWTLLPFVDSAMRGGGYTNIVTYSTPSGANVHLDPASAAILNV